MEDSLEKLRFLTKVLPIVPKIAELKMPIDGPSSVEYPIKDGVCLSYALFSSPDVSVARTFVTAGGIFPEHKHDETEYGLIVSGSAMVRSGDETKETFVGPGDMLIYEPGVVHYARALEDIWFIAMTIPYSKDYPDARTP